MGRKEQRKSPRGRYRKQKEHSVRRGVEFKLSFEEWWKIWEDSGKYFFRGVGKGKYCMCRNKDTGAYEVGNVYIDSTTNNIKDQHIHNKTLKNNLLPGARRLPQRSRDVINELCLFGSKVKDVAKLYSVTETTVYNIKREFKQQGTLGVTDILTMDNQTGRLVSAEGEYL